MDKFQRALLQRLGHNVDKLSINGLKGREQAIKELVRQRRKEDNAADNNRKDIVKRVK